MTKFKVITYDWVSFRKACGRLHDMVDQSGFHPDVVVGIPRGGMYLVEAGWPDSPQMNIQIRKPSGISLKKRIGGLVKYLPLSLRNRLRIWDAGRLVKRSGHMASTKILLPDLVRNIKSVLLVDDAVDSGATLAAVAEAFRNANPEIKVRSAVITVTGDKPLCTPDYYIYNNSTLVRLPWSIDAR